jgi:hypothetical protein
VFAGHLTVIPGARRFFVNLAIGHTGYRGRRTMNPITQEVREWIQLAAVLVACVGGVIAAFKAVFETRQSTEQRRAELRWRHAQASKELITDIHQDRHASNAVVMMDWSEGATEHEVEPGCRELLAYRDVLSALSKAPSDRVSSRDRYIRDAFDWFFYYIDRIELYIETGLIEFIDVRTVFKTYATKIQRDIQVYESFIHEREYELAPRFWRRYEGNT